MPFITQIYISESNCLTVNATSEFFQFIPPCHIRFLCDELFFYLLPSSFSCNPGQFLNNLSTFYSLFGQITFFIFLPKNTFWPGTQLAGPNRRDPTVPFRPAGFIILFTFFGDVINEMWKRVSRDTTNFCITRWYD
jgi:hypothetical protein